MTDLDLKWSWLAGNLDDRLEKETFAAIEIIVGQGAITRAFHKKSGGDRDNINVSLYPLALGIARNWWQIFYEPRKIDLDTAFESRHSIDTFMHGYVFPIINIWSGGDDVITIETPYTQSQHSKIEFAHPSVVDPVNISRNVVESQFYTLVDSVVERLNWRKENELAQMWTRITASISEPEERDYCIAAGRLGIDPYDEEAPDISVLGNGLPAGLFADICDAVTINELQAATRWAKEGQKKIKKFSCIPIEGFGEAPTSSFQVPGWQDGYQAARSARKNLGVEDLNPRKVVDEIFGSAVTKDSPILGKSPPEALEGVAVRDGTSLRPILPKSHARLRRSNLCRAAYLGWTSSTGASSGITSATTKRQQASRAFAAEILSPAEWLRDRAGKSGLTEQDIQGIAKENVCPEATIIWQAYNHKIPLRGVPVPSSFTSPRT